MDKALLKDVIEWDVKNWSKALTFWSDHVDVKARVHTCLELGGRRGGLSLWLAVNTNIVICSDLESPVDEASKLHEKYGCGAQIEYQAIDATNIPYENHFDIVVMKSILGGISGNGRNELKQKTIDEVYKSLKPGGKILFAENLESTGLHRFFRKKFITWGSRWNYLKYDEIVPLFKAYNKVTFKTTGFFGAFGRTENQRKLLSVFDAILSPLIPKSKKYIVYGVAEKGNDSEN